MTSLYSRLDGVPGDEDEIWDIARVAEYIGVTRSTVSSYLHRGQMPEPDHWPSVGPLWWSATIKEWHQNRPSQRREGM